MAIEVIGDPKSVEQYRKWLHEQGQYTKRYMNHFRKTGVNLAPKPEGFRILNTPIKKVWNKQQKDIIPIEDQKLYIAGVANENAVDRMDERLEPTGVDPKNFMKNQVLLVDHLYTTSAVVGRVIELRVESNGVHFEAYIGDPRKAPLTDTQKDVRSLVAQKLIQTVSVGFIPHKIQAPVFDDDFKLIEPAVILAWELLELSLVAVPANPGAVFDLKEVSFNETNVKKFYGLTKGSREERINKTIKRDTIHLLEFKKDKYDEDEAKEWASTNDYRNDPVHETEDSYQIVQDNIKSFEEGSFKTVDLKDGVLAVVGIIKSTVKEERIMEEKILEMIEEMKAIKTLLGSLDDNIKAINEKSETILGKLDMKEVEELEEEDEDEEEEESKEEDDEEEDDEEDEDEEDEKKGESEEDDEDDEDEEDEKKEKRLEIIEDSLVKMNEKFEILSGSLLKILEKANG